MADSFAGFELDQVLEGRGFSPGITPFGREPGADGEDAGRGQERGRQGGYSVCCRALVMRWLSFLPWNAGSAWSYGE